MRKVKKDGVKDVTVVSDVDARTFAQIMPYGWIWKEVLSIEKTSTK